MYSNYYNYPNYMASDNDRIIAGGGFVGPFLLGGLTGALLAPGFSRPHPYYQYPPFYHPPFYYRRFPRYYY